MNRRIYLEKLVFSQAFCFLTLIVFAALAVLGLNLVAKAIAPLILAVNSLILHEKINLAAINYGLIFSRTFFISTFFITVEFLLYSILSVLYACAFSDSSRKKYINRTFSFELLILKSLKWNIDRFVYIFKPVFMVLIALLVVTGIGFLLFNSLLLLAGISMGLVSFIFSFSFYMTFLGFIVAFMFSFKRAVCTIFGTNDMVGDINLKNSSLVRNSSDMLASSFANFVISLLYFLYSFMLLVQVFAALINASFLSEEYLVLSITIVTIDMVFWIGLNYLKSYLYSKSLYRLKNKSLFSQ